MNRAKIILCIVIISGVASVFAMHAHRTAKAVGARTEEIARQKLQMNEEQKEFAARSRLVEEDIALFRLKLQDMQRADQPSVVFAPPRLPRASQAVAPRKPTRQELMASSPDLVAAWRVYRSAVLQSSYGPFCQAAGLSPEQTEKLEDLLLKAEENSISSREAQKNSGNKPFYEAFHDELVALLGEEGTTSFQRYERTQIVRQNLVMPMAGELTLEGYPLSAHQGEKLAAVFAEASADFRDGRAATPTTIDWDAAYAQMLNLLSPDQMALLQSKIVSEQSNARLQALVTAWSEEQNAAKTSN